MGSTEFMYLTETRDFNPKHHLKRTIVINRFVSIFYKSSPEKVKRTKRLMLYIQHYNI